MSATEVTRTDKGYLIKIGRRKFIVTPEEADDLLNRLGGLRHMDIQESTKRHFYDTHPEFDPETGLRRRGVGS